MRLITNLACGVALALLVGCERATVTAPTPPAPVPPAQSPSNARLEIADLTATAMRPFASGYDIRFVLTNTAYTGVVVDTVLVEGEGVGSQRTGQDCWGRLIRVAGLHESIIFKGNTLSYCAPAIETDRELPEVKVTVFFTDDTGLHGSVTAKTRTTP